MFSKRTLLAFAAAGALTVATTVPALSMENEFHGMYRVFSAITNFNQTANTPETVDGGYYPGGNPKSPGTAAYLEQRVRVAYTARVNPDRKVVTMFEVNADFGDNAYSTHGTTVSSTAGGGAIGSSSVNLRTKEAYVDMNLPSTPVKVKVGIQPFSDSYKSVIFDTRAAGILATSPVGDATVTSAFFRFNDNFYSKTPVTPVASTSGNQTADFYLVDGKYSLNKDTKVGASYYLYYNDIKKPTQPKTYIHMFGVNAEAVIGPATINGFAVYQTGKDLEAKTLNAWALNLGTQCQAGKGSAHTEFLMLSGDHGNRSNKSNAFWVTQGDAAWENAYDAHLQLLVRDPSAMMTDNAIVFDNMHNQGVILGSVGYDLPLTSKLTGSANIGFGAVSRDNAAKPTNLVTGKANTSDFLGTELNVGLEYKIFEDVSVVPRFAYVVLGDYYKDVASNGTPANPYMASLVMDLKF